MAGTNRKLPALLQQVVDRIWAKVNKSSGQGPKGECWQWTAGLTQQGYGKFSIFRNQPGAGTYVAHRLIYFITRGEDPGELQVLHHCDNPPCCRPDHLFKGTHQDNMDDKVQKNRQAHCGPTNPACGEKSGARLHPETRARGERVGTSSLTQEIILAILADYYHKSIRSGPIARARGLSRTHISYITHGRVWQHITLPFLSALPKCATCGRPGKDRWAKNGKAFCQRSCLVKSEGWSGID